MNLTELELLLEIRKLELRNSLQDVQYKLGIGGRILRAIQKSGIIESLVQNLQTPPSSEKTDTRPPEEGSQTVGRNPEKSEAPKSSDPNPE